MPPNARIASAAHPSTRFGLELFAAPTGLGASSYNLEQATLSFRKTSYNKQDAYPVPPLEAGDSNVNS